MLEPDHLRFAGRILLVIIRLSCGHRRLSLRLPAAELVYAGVVLLHALGGVLATAPLIPFLFRRLRAETLAARGGWLLISAGAILGSS